MASTATRHRLHRARWSTCFPDGTARALTDGILRARYRNGKTTPALLTPGEPTSFTIDVGATSNVFLPGHRIRLEVSSSNFPRFDRNPNTGGVFGTDAATVRGARRPSSTTRRAVTSRAAGDPAMIVGPKRSSLARWMSPVGVRVARPRATPSPPARTAARLLGAGVGSRARARAAFPGRRVRRLDVRAAPRLTERPHPAGSPTATGGRRAPAKTLDRLRPRGADARVPGPASIARARWRSRSPRRRVACISVARAGARRGSRRRRTPSSGAATSPIRPRAPPPARWSYVNYGLPPDYAQLTRRSACR